MVIPRASAPALLFVLLAAGFATALPDPGVAPGNVVVLAGGFDAERIIEGHPFATSLAVRDGKLLLIEAGRYHYADPYAGQRAGKLTEFAFAPDGSVASERVVVDGLEDPIGLAVAPNGDVYFSEYTRVSRIASASVDSATPVAEPHSWDYPTQTTDIGFLPVTGTYVPGVVPSESGGLEPDTTGTMGLSFRPSDARLFVSQSLHGTPPDDVLVRDLTGLDYDNPYSSAVLSPAGGALTPDQVAARACRNCFDLAFAPEGHPNAGELFITENVGPYRARLAAGSGRTALEGSTVTDQNVLDGINHVDVESGQIRRVATFRPDSGIAGTTPTGIAFAPATFADFESEMFVALMSGFVPQTDERGEIVVVRPEMVAGAATGVPFAVGLDFPIDLAFTDAGELFVLEYYSGNVYRFSPTE